MSLTLEKYKALCGVKGDDLDDQITALMPLVESDFSTLASREASDDDVLVLSEMLSYKLQTLRDGAVGSSTETVGGYSHSYDFRRMRGYPVYIVQKIQRPARAHV